MNLLAPAIDTLMGNPLSSENIGGLADGVIGHLRNAVMNEPLPFHRDSATVSKWIPDPDNPFPKYSPEWNLYNRENPGTSIHYKMAAPRGFAPMPDVTPEMIEEGAPIRQIRDKRRVYVSGKGVEARKRPAIDGNNDLLHGDDPGPYKRMRIPYDPSLITEYE